MSRIVVLVASLAAGTGAAWLSFRDAPAESALAPVRAEAAPVEAVALEQVLTAAVDLPHRHRLTPEDLRWQPWPAGAVPDGFVTRSAQPDAVESFAGGMVRVGMIAGEPVQSAKLAATEAGFMSALLPAGMRAIAVRVTAETTAGGFILPEDRVDVLHTTTQAGADGVSTGLTRTILTNVRVLAVDQQIESEAATVARTATLELDPKQAEVVAAAEASGTLSLALRSVADNAEAPRVPPPAERTITLINAGRSQVVRTQ